MGHHPRNETGGLSPLSSKTPVTELDRCVRESVAVTEFKRLRKFYLVDELPRDPFGNVQTFQLQDGTPDIEPET